MLSSSVIVVGHSLGRSSRREVILGPIVDKLLHLGLIEGRGEGMGCWLDEGLGRVARSRDELPAATLTLDVIGQWLMRLMVMYIHHGRRMMYFDLLGSLLETPVLVDVEAPFLLAQVRALPISLLAVMIVAHLSFITAYHSWRFIVESMPDFFH